MSANDESVTGDLSCFVLMALFLFGLALLAVRLKEVQVDEAADYNYASARQSVRRVQTPGVRGRILDRSGRVLADNRTTLSVVCDVAQFGGRTLKATEDSIKAAISNVAQVVGRPSPLTDREIERHLKQSLARPLVVWRTVDWNAYARFSEREREFPGFRCVESTDRRYPFGRLAAHAIGYVGREEVLTDAGDEKFNFRERELRGRSGLERYYDAFLRGVPGEEKVLVDARGFAVNAWTVVEPQTGPDLILSLDAAVQRVAEAELTGLRGACVAMDPRNGEILAFVSSPAYDLNRCVPTFPKAYYSQLTNDVRRPLVNRASGGAYPPGSTFKPITALAALASGASDKALYECCGVFFYGNMHLRCSRRWGHGDLDMRHALMRSCNPYFCNQGTRMGTNALISAAKAFGLGSKTGIDFGSDRAGTVPSAEWKQANYNEAWVPGDLVQMSIGQGMLLTSPLQMARVAGALATGYLVTPHFKRDLPIERRPLPFTAAQFKVVREGMRMVVAGDGVDPGTGHRGGDGVAVPVSGKTGTAEVGGEWNRRKMTWFIAFAPSDRPTVAIAMVIEDGESGGGTTAPKVAEVLKAIFGKAPSTR